MKQALSLVLLRVHGRKRGAFRVVTCYESIISDAYRGTCTGSLSALFTVNTG